MARGNDYLTSNGVNLYVIFIAMFAMSLGFTIYTAARADKLRKIKLANEQKRSDLLDLQKQQLQS